MMPLSILNQIEEQVPQTQTLTLKALLLLQDLYADLAAFLRRLLPEDDGVVLPHPTLNSIITYLLGFVAIKAQCHPDFPYITHHNSVLAAVISLVMFGVTSATEHIATCLVDQPPVIKGSVALGYSLIFDLLFAVCAIGFS
ncbi:hypothetical protein Tco_0983432 [Tanacetum coccineum]